MAKMFYTLEEAAGKLGKSADTVREMAEKGQLQEFRDRDRLMFKVEQVDLLAGGEDHIPLVDSGQMDAINLGSAAASGTGMALDKEGSKESTGIALFDADSTEEADANAVTRVQSAPVSLSDPGKGGSGSRAGLLDLTKEPDDTSLGGGLLDDVYGNETVAQQTAVEAPTGGGEVGVGGAGLFETPAVEGLEPAAAGVGALMMPMEMVDGPWSGALAGAALGMILTTGVAIFAVVMGLAGAAGTGLLGTLGDNLMIIAGAGLGVVILGAVLGFFIGKKS